MAEFKSMCALSDLKMESQRQERSLLRPCSSLTYVYFEQQLGRSREEVS
jgi:hypothetical protein